MAKTNPDDKSKAAAPAAPASAPASAATAPVATVVHFQSRHASYQAGSKKDQPLIRFENCRCALDAEDAALARALPGFGKDFWEVPATAPPIVDPESAKPPAATT